MTSRNRQTSFNMTYLPERYKIPGVHVVESALDVRVQAARIANLVVFPVHLQSDRKQVAVLEIIQYNIIIFVVSRFKFYVSRAFPEHNY